MKKIQKIKQGALSRGLSIAKWTLSNGIGVGKALLEDAEDRVPNLVKRAKSLAEELGVLKGSMMKVGQMLTVYGEYFFPPEVNEALKSLRSDSARLEWGEIKKVLEKELGKEIFQKFDIEEEAFAAASLGQVHRAKKKNEKEWSFVFKIQYPGVSEAIDSDLKTLKFLLKASKLVPKDEMGNERLDALFEEVREVLKRETDYLLELRNTDRAREKIANDSRFIIPKTYEEFSTKKVLCLEYVESLPMDDPKIQKFSLEERNRISIAVLELYYQEVFQWGWVQTDPHLGNYRLKTDSKQNQIVLLDFGAIRSYSKTFIKNYKSMIECSIKKDWDGVEEAALAIGFLQPKDESDLIKKFCEMCDMIVSPLRLREDEVYYWAKSDLPKKVFQLGSKIAFQFKLRPPPKEMVFLDRKTAGMYSFLASMKAEFSGREIRETLKSSGIELPE